MRNSRAGFTLIEIMVVVVIISLLAVFATGTIIYRMRTAETRIAKTQIRTLRDKVQMYYLDRRRYPDRLEELLAGESPYAEREELRDPWGNAFIYQRPGPGGRPFTIGSFGADGAQGGSGSDADIWLHDLGEQ